MMKLLIKLSIAILFGMQLSGMVFAQDKQQARLVALVIGNSAYKSTMALRNPVNDAVEITKKLSSIGFSVTTVTDASFIQINDALSSFRVISTGADIGVLFYSGHGFVLDGKVYMIPVDASANEKTKLVASSVGLYTAVEKFMVSKKKIVLYDSDLGDLFADRGASVALSTISYPQDALMAFAASLGGAASDGVGSRNSPFTTALLEHLGDPNDIAVVLRKVREKVMQATGGKQQPWEYGSLTGGELVLSAIRPQR